MEFHMASDPPSLPLPKFLLPPPHGRRRSGSVLGLPAPISIIFFFFFFRRRPRLEKQTTEENFLLSGLPGLGKLKWTTQP